MNEKTCKDKHLDDPVLPFPNPSAHIEFYKKFKREADEYDNDFIKKFSDEADTTLIFAGLFSAVTSAFIIDVQSQLQPDYTQMSYALLTIIASASLGKIPTGPDAAFPKWTGPDPAIVHVQSILYSSLAASLLAALVATLGKQWLHRFAQVEMTGSIADRSRNRVRRLDGMVTWRFDLVMESLPLMLQIALLLLGYALSNYLFFVNRAVAGVVIGFTSFGLLFYLLIVSAATFSYNCPFQTPASLIIRLMIRSGGEHKTYLSRSRKWFQRIFSFFWRWKRSRTRTVGLHGLGNLNGVDGNVVGDHIELATTVAPLQLPFTFDKTVWDGYVQDSDSINRLFGISTDADVVLTITKLIPEIVWHPGIEVTPLERVYNVVLEYFDRSSGRLVVIPKLRNEAYFGAKALLHLAIQRQCIGRESDAVVFESISRRHQNMGSRYYGGDSDLESTLGIIDCIFNAYGSEVIPWKEFSLTDSHRTWMGHILLYLAWHSLGNGGRLPDYIVDFFSLPLRMDPPPPAPISLNFLHIIGLLLDIRFGVGDQQVVDKSLNRIYKVLAGTFLNPGHTADMIDRAVVAMRLIRLLCEEYDTNIRGQSLFNLVMGTQVSPAFPEEKKWEVSRLALHLACKWEKPLRVFDDPEHIPTFLRHHFDLASQGYTQDEPIQDALHALTYASDRMCLKNLNPTYPTFVRGICFAFGRDRPLPLRKAVFFFLPLIANIWFNSPTLLMGPDQMESFCKDWASAVDDVGAPEEVRRPALEVLFSMINSPGWRPHIVQEKWKLLESFILDWEVSEPEDFQLDHPELEHSESEVSEPEVFSPPALLSKAFELEVFNPGPEVLLSEVFELEDEPLGRCLGNLELIDGIPSVGSPSARVLWLAVLWLNCEELTSEVRVKLEAATGEISRADIEVCLSVVEVELSKVEDTLLRYSTTALCQKKSGLEQARDSLTSFQRTSC